jgi:TPP-dependent indolepyruvate ferredoxin oxidoreductase alpha subunit
MPYLYPSSIHEMIEMGLLGIAMSRYSGCWVGMKVITETVETTAEIDLNDEMTPLSFRPISRCRRAVSICAGRTTVTRRINASRITRALPRRLRPRQQDQPHHDGFAERAVRHHGLGQKLRGHSSGAA